jgi:transposase InsO family protein
LVEPIVELHRRRPVLGSKKILARLQAEHPEITWPARSTIDAILKREGLVPDRVVKKRRRRVGDPLPVEAKRPNEVWTADHKGWFELGDKSRCERLTVSDMSNRYSLSCRALINTRAEGTRKAFERCFREHGLPQGILTDNGPPFGSSGPCGFSQLTVWFLRLGIKPYYIEPGKPQQNGKHERFHRTLRLEAANPPRANQEAQQRALNQFRNIYNNERPHEALGQQTPASLYVKSPRLYPGEVGDFEYPPQMKTLRISKRGSMR